MKTAGILMLALVATAGWSQSIKIQENRSNSVDQEYDGAYTRQNEVSLTGFVTGKVKGDPNNGKTGGMSIELKTSKGKVYQVDLGPTWYVQAQSTPIDVGDRVKVIGSPIKFGENNERIVLAREVVKHKEVLALRDSSGMPYWLIFRKGNDYTAQNGKTITGKIVSSSSINIANEKADEVAYQLMTDKGLVNVAAAPNWFLSQTGLGFHVGDTITVYTGVGPAQFGGAILANGIYGNGYGGTVMLRPNGIPLWYSYPQNP